MFASNASERLTEKAVKAYAGIEDARLREVLESLIRHLHGCVKEVRPTEQEWEFAWDFMRRMAEFTGDERNEFLLLADVLGVSQLVEVIGHDRSQSAVGFALVGPFYRANAPFRQRGESVVSADTAGDRVRITGKVYDLDSGKPLAGAVLDVWQAATNGLYENQDENQPDYNLRGLFRTDEAGTFELVALLPTPYPVPTDGPVGELLRVAKRSVLRPAHIHFIVRAPGYETLITQVFVDGDDLIDLDVVFTASDNMIGKFQRDGDHYRLQYDFQLKTGVSMNSCGNVLQTNEWMVNMKALRFNQTGSLSELRVTSMAQPVHRHGEVLVRVQAAAINPSDVKNVMGKMNQTTLPRTPGRDFAGVIEQGPADLIGRSVFGTGGDLGFRRDGSHAEYLIVPVEAVVPRPDRLSAEQAAAMGLAYELVATATAGHGADVVLDVVGGPLFEPCLKSLAHRGRQVAIASTGDPKVSFDLVDFYHREGRLFGVDTLKLGFAESASVLRGLLKGIESGEFKPPELETVTLDGAVSAYQAINSGTARKKQVIVF